MSIETARKFMELVKNSEDLQKELAACNTDEEKLGIAKSHGYEFTNEEILEYLEEDRELSPEELDMVAGGSQSIAYREGGNARRTHFHPTMEQENNRADYRYW